MRSYASAYKMCVVTFPSRLNRTARSRRAGPRARRPPDQLAGRRYRVLPERGGEQLRIHLAALDVKPDAVTIRVNWHPAAAPHLGPVTAALSFRGQQGPSSMRQVISPNGSVSIIIGRAD